MARPPKFKDEYIEQVYKLCLLGATDVELAGFFDVCEATINNWKNKVPEFLESIKKGKSIADMQVAEKLHQRATGYEWTEEHAFKLKKGRDIEEVEVVEVRKEIPPDPTSMIFWLKNRQPEKWRDKQDVNLSGGVSITRKVYGRDNAPE